MPRYGLNVIVCTDPRRCADASVNGRNGDNLADGLRLVVLENGLAAEVQVTECRCIFGCTYGPRIDVARRWSGEKLLYGAVDGDAAISRRGRVRFNRIPDDLGHLIFDNLPQYRRETHTSKLGEAYDDSSNVGGMPERD
ncbi:MAG TPA: (2Fe-2S) ferredoxin domain-containing protein [Dehalococcoidia bacterium]|nr:(2Fe-2S) ferredoxin domain-containing protein [Dehalococcoidia bacterium]